MQTLKNFCLPLATLLLMVLLVPSSVWAGTGPTITNCPTEPKLNVPIVSGQTYYGSNCSVSTIFNVDEFAFTAAAGDIWQMSTGFGATPASPQTDLCLTLYAPGVPQNQIFSGCTCHGCGNWAVGTTQTLPTAGTYTIQISENSDAAQTYAVSLERLSPTAPEAVPLVLTHDVADGTTAPTSQDTFSFVGATTGTYELGVMLDPNPTSDVCVNVYQPDGSSVLGGYQCTCYGCGSGSLLRDITPPVDGTYLVEVAANGGDSTVSYDLELSCLLGKCPPSPLPCELTDSPSYDATTGVLTMDFTVATPTAATWDAWLTIKNKSESIFSQSLPVTEPASQVTQTKSGLTASGTVGVLSVISTSSQGITCSSFVTVDTGKP